VQPVAFVDPQQAASAEKSDQGCRLELMLRILHKARDLPGRLPAPATDPDAARVIEVACIQFPDPVVGEPGAVADRTRAGFMPDHAERELELAALAGVAVIGQSHNVYLVTEIDHIQVIELYYYPQVVILANI
jgi:hypothetical protein